MSISHFGIYVQVDIEYLQYILVVVESSRKLSLDHRYILVNKYKSYHDWSVYNLHLVHKRRKWCKDFDTIY